jgi:integrase
MLSDLKIRSAKPTTKTQTLSDGRGLCLVISPTGVKGWRFRYSKEGKAKLLSLGPYPTISLAEARARREELLKQLAQGLDPAQERKKQQSHRITTLDDLFAAWYAIRSQEWTPSHAERNLRRYQLHIQPWLGDMEVAAITPLLVLEQLQRIQVAGTLETAHRTKGVLSAAFDHAVIVGLITHNPCASLGRALITPPKRHYAAPTSGQAIGPILRQIWGYPGSPITRAAIQIGVYLFPRPGELRQMKWSEINGAVWSRRVSKINQDLITPLPHQVTSILDAIRPFTGHSEYVFPSARSDSRPMSQTAILGAFRRMGIGGDELVGHSWRAAARTVCDEVLGFRPDAIEHSLGHQVRDALGRAYNRVSHLQERTKLAQAWADWVDNQRVIHHL